MANKNIIVWAWPTGITLAQRLSEKWELVEIIEKRDHIWGNCYDYFDEDGILIHKYGPHIFHTDSEEVWNYLCRFTTFTDFEHKVLWLVDGKLIPIPFNLNSLRISFSIEMATKISESLFKYYEYWSKVSIVDLRKKSIIENDPNLSFIANYIYEKVFKNYTVKQWWISPEEINEEVLKRVPVVIWHDDRYFPHHQFQWMPSEWYTKMFEKMLDNKNISIILNSDYKDIISNCVYDTLYFTWPIDEYFGYKYGKLDYRKTLYQLESYDMHSYQENIVINYPNENEYTRITEFKKFYPQSPSYNKNKTVICKELPWIWDIEAYPVETLENLEKLEKYKKDASELSNVYFLWRLASFKYTDMDKTILAALKFNI